jgi:hypothetical protein
VTVLNVRAPARRFGSITAAKFFPPLVTVTASSAMAKSVNRARIA